MRRNLAPSQKGSPTLHQRIGVAFPQGFVPPIRSNVVTVPKKKSELNSANNLQMRPAISVANTMSNNESEITDENSRYFNAVWCKQSTRKHKKWEGDALLIIKANERLAILRDADNDGKEISRGSSLPMSKLSNIENGSVISFGGKDIEIMDEITYGQYKKCLSICKQRAISARKLEESRKIDELAKASGLQPQKQYSDVSNEQNSKPQGFPSPKFKPFVMPSKLVSQPDRTISATNSRQNFKAMFDPTHPDAIVLPRPIHNSSLSQASDSSQGNENEPNSDIVDVIIEPLLGRQLRPHQVDGVLFLYKCVMGYQVEGSFGAILADEMGLGKTLQTIALIWTLIKQSPFGYGKSVINTALILAPSSLIKNWESEFTKWLGKERINVCGVDSSASLLEYIKLPQQARAPVLIMSYELFTRTFTSIDENLTFDLVVCDEGHRLKNAGAKASQCLAQMSQTDRRIVLTGTPLQNELKEFYAIVNIVCPGILGSVSQFTRQFEEPILRSKQPGASKSDLENGQEIMENLTQLTGQFILRRTQDIIKSYLPSKTEYVLFCPMSALQAYIFENLISDTLGQSNHSSGELNWDNLDRIDSKCILATINQFRKICNHPSFIETEGSSFSPENLPQELANLTYEEQGSKLAVVSCILHALRQQGRQGEKIVLVSISTKVLDLLGELCEHYGYATLRLDGSTSSAARDRVVSRFNSPYTDTDDAFVLLLSSKAGGTGLNLIGASRILLYDMDWNPANDLQAMARVWRDGQKRKVHVYRLATAGSIEEKIFQRQVTKQGLGGVLSDISTDSTVQKNHFSNEELKDLFSFNHEATCDTHSLINCSCEGDGSNILNDKGSKYSEIESDSEYTTNGHKKEVNNQKRVEMQDLLQWKHFDPNNSSERCTQLMQDPILKEALRYLSYVFLNEAHASAIHKP